MAGNIADEVKLAIEIAGFIGTMGTGLLGLGWWISKQFMQQDKARGEGLQVLADKFTEVIDRHEEIDQRRHEENLGRFSIINERLARLGNGRS